MILTRRSALAGAFLLAGCATLEPPGIGVETVRLWPGDPPGAAGVVAREEVIERSKDPARPDRAVIHVRTPTLKIFRPARPDGSAVLVAPGGAYQRVVLDKEGDETAMRLAQAGVTAAVLVYRLPEDGWASGIDAPLEAVTKIRYKDAGSLSTIIQDGDQMIVDFHHAVTGIAPGQSAVFYEGSDLLGGGFLM